MNFTLIIIAIIVVAVLIVLAGIWLNKKGITKDDNDNYIPDVLEDKAKEIKKKAKDIGNIVKNKK
jgi:FtsZ-interacting cell division protein ZipA